MVKMNGFAAIDSVRPFRFWADKAAVAADFHLRKWHLLSWKTKNRPASTAGVCTLCDFRLGKQGTAVPTLHTCHYVKNILGKQCTCGHTSCFLQISALLPFAKTCWATSQTLQRFFQNRLRSCGAEHHSILESEVRIFRIPS